MTKWFIPKRNTLTNSATVAAGGVVLTTYAIYNGFPLVYPDTGTYVAACMEAFIPKDRPLTYSFFLRHLSLKETLWIPMVVQCLIVSWLIWMLFRHFTSVKKIAPWHLGTVVFLTITTGLAANADLLIPDIFTSVMLISGALILFAENIPRNTMIFLSLLFAGSMTTHLSHYPLACAMIACVFVVWFFRRKKPESGALIRRTVLLGLLVPSAVAMTVLTNYWVARKWQFNPGSGHVFMMNRLIQIGVINDYLNKVCPHRHTTMCDYRPHWQQDFLWDMNSPLNRHYGWDGWGNAKPEYDSIISEVFDRPEYVRAYIFANLRDARIQLTTFDITTMRQLMQGSAVHDVLERNLPRDHARYVQSKQAKGTLSYELISSIQKYCAGITFAILLVIMFLRKTRTRMAKLFPFTLWIFVGMIFNALTVVSVAMIDSRYQSRLIWIIPLIVCCYLAHVFSIGDKSETTDSHERV